MSPTPVSTVRPDTGARRAWWLGGALVLLTGVLALASLAVGSTGAEFGAFIRTEQARWKQVIERAQIKPEGMG